MAESESCENSGVGVGEEEDQWAKLPDEVQDKIFKLCRWRQLYRASCVCKSLNEGVDRYVKGLPLFATAVPVFKGDNETGVPGKS